MGRSIFVTGIDTDAGKTYATAWMLQQYAAKGVRAISQKFIQTGNVGHSEDIDAHRRLCGTGLLPEDEQGLTAPVIYSFPASAQLAARIDGDHPIPLERIDAARTELERRYDIVLVEGAGGLMVPITDDFMAIDYARTRNLPVALVTNSKLGSINHTVLSLEAVAARGMTLHCVLYNTFLDSKDTLIAEDTRAFVARYVERYFPGTPIYDIPVM